MRADGGLIGNDVQELDPSGRRRAGSAPAGNGPCGISWREGGWDAHRRPATSQIVAKEMEADGGRPTRALGVTAGFRREARLWRSPGTHLPRLAVRRAGRGLYHGVAGLDASPAVELQRCGWRISGHRVSPRVTRRSVASISGWCWRHAHARADSFQRRQVLRAPAPPSPYEQRIAMGPSCGASS